jgi:hypothetical protein
MAGRQIDMRLAGKRRDTEGNNDEQHARYDCGRMTLQEPPSMLEPISTGQQAKRKGKCPLHSPSYLRPLEIPP